MRLSQGHPKEARHDSSQPYSSHPPENYERYFVPAIGRPVAASLVEAAALKPAERVLDVGCGTGVVARLAAERVGAARVAGVDPNPGMLAVARAVSPPEVAWHQAGAEDMPLPDGGFDVVLCQMALQFMEDPPAALREMRRVLADGGRALLVLVGPIPPMFHDLGEALARHLGPLPRDFVHRVFSLHDPDRLRLLLAEAGFREVQARRDVLLLRLPEPREFMGQYIHSTPMAAAWAPADEERRQAVESEVVARWRSYLDQEGALTVEPELTWVTGRK